MEQETKALETQVAKLSSFCLFVLWFVYVLKKARELPPSRTRIDTITNKSQTKSKSIESKWDPESLNYAWVDIRVNIRITMSKTDLSWRRPKLLIKWTTKSREGRDFPRTLEQFFDVSLSNLFTFEYFCRNWKIQKSSPLGTTILFLDKSLIILTLRLHDRKQLKIQQQLYLWNELLRHNFMMRNNPPRDFIEL